MPIARRRLFLAGAAALIGTAGRARAARTVRFGSVGGLTDAGVLLADEFGYLTSAGVSVQMVRLPSAPALLTALATGQLDIAGISVTPGLFTSIQRGVQIRIVGDKQSVRPGFSATRLVVRTAMVGKDEAATVQALKGKTIAISAKAAGIYMVVLNYLAAHGLSASDVRFVELSYPSMVPALGSGAVDAAAVLEPFLSQSLQMGVAKPLNDLVAASGATAEQSITSVPLVYSEAFAREHDPAQSFMDSYIRGVRLYNDAFAKGKDREKIVEILARRVKVDAKVIRDGFPAGLDPNGHVSRKFLEECQAFFVKQHYMDATIDLNKVLDPAFAKASVARLGSYA